MDETYIKVRGQWKYLYRAVDKPNDLRKQNVKSGRGGLRRWSAYLWYVFTSYRSRATGTAR